MEQCAWNNGVSLLQRWTSAFSVTNGASSALLSETVELSQLDANVSVAKTRVADALWQLPTLVNATGILGSLPNGSMNMTRHIANRRELGNSLLVNVSVFLCGVVFWVVLCPCMQAICRRRARNMNGESSSASPLSSASSRNTIDVHADAPKRNYLLYMQICMYTCMVLSLVHLCFLLWHGLVAKVFFGGWSILMVLGEVSFAEIYFITFLDGCIILAFSELFHKLIEIPERDLAQERLRRTVWMKGLPTHDSMRYWRQFRLSPLEVGRVKRDLIDALTDTLHQPSQNAGVLFGARPRDTLESWASPNPVLPLTPAPIDLLSTSWQCHLDVTSGNPYYTNSVSGAVQWELPAELSNVGVAENPVVEEISVSLILDEWLSVHTALQQAREYLEAYEAKLERAYQDISDASYPLVLRFFRRPSAWWYDRRISQLKPEITALSGVLEAIRADKKSMCGSAFVTFKHSRHRDRFLKEEEDHIVSSWIWAPSYSYFSFGRPPFASVTLLCERAPHPSDIIWQNLHVSWWQRTLVFWTLASLLFFVMVLLVTAVGISEFVVPIIKIARKEIDALEQLRVWQDFVPMSVKTFVTSLNHEMIWRSVLEQVPTLVLLFINSVMVPAAITGIARCERTATLSDAEITRMLVNFFFLFTNTVVVPLCGVASLNELAGMFITALKEKNNPAPLQGVVFASPGVLALKYLMNATFISSTNQLLQIPQSMLRWFQLTFLAVTERDKAYYQKPWPFYWGYWYAWTLSIFALGINMSVTCPSTLPIAGLFFFMKYAVDKHNLEKGIYAGGTDIEGGLAIRVVCYLRFVVAMWWFAMGALSCAISVFEPHGILILSEKMWLRRGGITLITSGAITFGCSWWLKVQQLHHLRLRGPTRNSQPTIWEDIGEALFLIERRQRSGIDGSLSSTWDPSQGLASATKMKEGQVLNWDGARSLGLE
jgi:hypothetical protein